MAEQSQTTAKAEQRQDWRLRMARRPVLRTMFLATASAAVALTGVFVSAGAQIKPKGRKTDMSAHDFTFPAIDGGDLPMKAWAGKPVLVVNTASFCGFTKQSAQMDSQDVVDMLNHYFQPMVDNLFRYDGTVDKFVGDAVLAVFGSPEPDPQQHAKAVRAALAMQEAVQATTQLRAARGDITCRVRIGIHCGEVFHGFVGTNERLEFTVIGDVVNRTCRYCEAAGEGEVLISQDIFQRVFNLVKAEKTSIQTKEGDLTAYRILGLRS